MIRGHVFSVGLLVLVGAAVLPGCIGQRDESDFREFKYSQSPTQLGFCPKPDSVHEATITKSDDAAYTLNMSVLRENDSEDCVGAFITIDGTCVEVQDLPSRTLTANEIVRVREEFRRVEIHAETFPMLLCIDLCRIELYQWDDFSIEARADDCVVGVVESLDDDTEDRVVAMLEDLRDGG